jgi:hypothetical protein
MNGVSAEGPALICAGQGFFPWQSETGNIILVKCYYSAEAAEIIISSNNVITNHLTDLNAWRQYCNVDDGKECIKFHSSQGKTPYNTPYMQPMAYGTTIFQVV